MGKDCGEPFHGATEILTKTGTHYPIEAISGSKIKDRENLMPHCRWKSRMDIVNAFVEETFIVTGVWKNAVSKEDVYSAYIAYLTNKKNARRAGCVPINGKDNLIRAIVSRYHGQITTAKVRRGTRENTEDKKLRSCITGIIWRNI